MIRGARIVEFRHMEKNRVLSGFEGIVLGNLEGSENFLIWQGRMNVRNNLFHE
jgi:hypothetical protein